MPMLDRMALFGYLSQMIVVGIPLARALASISEQYAAGPSKQIVGALAVGLANGRSLSEAMADFPRAFSRLQIGVVAAGERSGSLPDIFSRLARYEERRLSLTRHVRSLLVYPLVVFVAAVCLIVGLAHVLLTGVSPLLEQARVKTNLLTSLVLWAAGVTRDGRVVFVLLLVAAGLAAGVREWLSTEAGGEWRERVLLRVPVVGPLLRRIETVHLCESLATLVACGVPLLKALDAAAATCTQHASRDALVRVAADVRRGRPLSEALAGSAYFSRSVSQMVAVGEQSGALPRMLGRVAEYQDLEVRTALEAFAAAIEPAMIVGLGLVVAGIILVAFAPLYQLISVLG